MDAQTPSHEKLTEKSVNITVKEKSLNPLRIF